MGDTTEGPDNEMQHGKNDLAGNPNGSHKHYVRPVCYGRGEYGGVAGAIIGILGGLAIPITVPHGHMSRSIAGISLIVCTIMAFIQHGHFLMEMTLGRIAITFLWVVMMFFFAIPISGMVKFIERMRVDLIHFV